MPMYFAGRAGAQAARASFSRGGHFSMHTASIRNVNRQVNRQVTQAKQSRVSWPTSKSSPYVCFANLSACQNLNRVQALKPLGVQMSTLSVGSVQNTGLGGEGESATALTTTSTTSAGHGQSAVGTGVLDGENSESEVTNSRKKVNKHRRRLRNVRTELGVWNVWDDC